MLRRMLSQAWKQAFLSLTQFASFPGSDVFNVFFMFSPFAKNMILKQTSASNGGQWSVSVLDFARAYACFRFLDLGFWISDYAKSHNLLYHPYFHTRRSGWFNSGRNVSLSELSFHVQERLLGASEEALEEFFLALDEDLKAKNFSWTAKGKQAQLVVIFDSRFLFKPEKLAVEWQMFVFFLVLALLWISLEKQLRLFTGSSPRGSRKQLRSLQLDTWLGPWLTVEDAEWKTGHSEPRWCICQESCWGPTLSAFLVATSKPDLKNGSSNYTCPPGKSWICLYILQEDNSCWRQWTFGPRQFTEAVATKMD